MKLRSNVNDKIYEIYNIRDDKKGYPHVLIYEDRQWKYVSMKYFYPVKEEAE